MMSPIAQQLSLSIRDVPPQVSVPELRRSELRGPGLDGPDRPASEVSSIQLRNALLAETVRGAATDARDLPIKQGDAKGTILSLVFETQSRWEQEYRTMRTSLERAKGPVRALLEAQDSAQRIQRTSELIGRAVDSFGEAIRKVNQSAASG